MQAESFFTSENCPAKTPTPNSVEAPSLEQFLDQARSEGYRVQHQSAWPNGAGWIALAHQLEGENRVDLMVNYYPDRTFTSRSV